MENSNAAGLPEIEGELKDSASDQSPTGLDPATLQKWQLRFMFGLHLPGSSANNSPGYPPPPLLE